MSISGKGWSHSRALRKPGHAARGYRGLRRRAGSQWLRWGRRASYQGGAWPGREDSNLRLCGPEMGTSGEGRLLITCSIAVGSGCVGIKIICRNNSDVAAGTSLRPNYGLTNRTHDIRAMARQRRRGSSGGRLLPRPRPCSVPSQWRRPSADASRASCSTLPTSCAARSAGATIHEPPTQATLASAR
jgi:hypothetical protein